MTYKLKSASITDITRLPFPKEPCNYVYKKEGHGNLLFTGLVYSVNRETYDKVINIFKGSDKHTIVKGDKVYILPGHSLSKSRIKEYLKSNNATLTDDITKATAIAGLDEPDEDVSMYGTPKLNSLFFELSKSGSFWIKDLEADYLDNHFTELTLELDLTLRTISTNDAYSNLKQYDNNGGVFTYYDKEFITGKAMEIMYYILTNKVKVLTEDYIGSNANSTVKLEDDEVYESIYTMLDSSDRNTNNMGIELLIHADLRGKTLYKLFKLAQDHGWLVNRHTKSKSVKHFLNTTDWSTLMNLDEEGLLDYMKSNNKLELKAIKELIPTIYSSNLYRLERANNDEFFSISPKSTTEKVTVVLNEEWNKYLNIEEDEFIKIKKHEYHE
jgi:hypothetical protein